VLATDVEAEALELVERNARENGARVETLRVDWGEPADLLASAPFDLVLAADVLYEEESAAPLLSLLPRLGREVWLADPGRARARAFVERARERWTVTTAVRDGIDVLRLTSDPRRRTDGDRGIQLARSEPG
jgi:predicted nicotinamide N-methyase